jgi:hypothetical protein
LAERQCHTRADDGVDQPLEAGVGIADRDREDRADSRLGDRDPRPSERDGDRHRDERRERQ